MKRHLLIFAVLAIARISAAQTAQQHQQIVTPFWSVAPLPDWFSAPAQPADAAPLTFAQIERAWKELTLGAATQIDQAYRQAFIESARAQFDLFDARGLLNTTNPQRVIERVLEPFKAAERRGQVAAERGREEESRARTAAIDMLRDRLARLDELQRRLDEQARADQFLAAIRRPQPVRCNSWIFGSWIQTNCN